jgi:hypothetical protein
MAEVLRYVQNIHNIMAPKTCLGIVHLHLIRALGRQGKTERSGTFVLRAFKSIPSGGAHSVRDPPLHIKLGWKQSKHAWESVTLIHTYIHNEVMYYVPRLGTSASSYIFYIFLWMITPQNK